jgi:hypothetical protein
MATKNQRIAAYVPENVYQKYQSFKAEKGLGDSQALIQILSEYFGVSHTEPLGSSLTLVERVERLEELIQASLTVQSPVATPDPIPIEPELKTDLPAVSPGQLSFLTREEVELGSQSNAVPAKADGMRWLTSRQAHQKAVLRGCVRNEEGFKKWSLRKPDQCSKDFHLRRLSGLTKSNTAPSFEDLKYLDSVQVKSDSPEGVGAQRRDFTADEPAKLSV